MSRSVAVVAVLFGLIGSMSCVCPANSSFWVNNDLAVGPLSQAWNTLGSAIKTFKGNEKPLLCRWFGWNCPPICQNLDAMSNLNIQNVSDYLN